MNKHQDCINFADKYVKLEYPIFLTIRGKSWFPKIKINDTRTIRVKRKHNCIAKLIYKKIMKIKNIPIEFLRWDTDLRAPNGKVWIQVINHEDFVELLNRFYPRSVYQSMEATFDTEVTILILENIGR